MPTKRVPKQRSLHGNVTVGRGCPPYPTAKNERNVRERNLPFQSAGEFDFENALVQIDVRQEYGERRCVALGNLRGRLHVLCFTETHDGIRVISFRKANDREVKNYAKVQTTD